MDSNKAPGIDDIPAKLIKASKYVISTYLSKMLYYCLENGYYFDKLKVARVTPIYIACLHDQNKSGFFGWPAFIQPIRAI